MQQACQQSLMEQIAGKAQWVIHPDRDALARYGISVGQFMSLVSDSNTASISHITI